MVELLPKIYLHGNRPSFYDSDSLTVLELSANLHGKVNELINDYNKFVDNTNKIIADFMNGEVEKREIFETALRQEFQDFIDIINLKIIEQDTKIDNAVKYMKTNLMDSALAIIEAALANEGIELSTNYDENTQALEFVYIRTE